MNQRDYAPDYASIPPHGRWQHFDAGGRPRVDQLLASWPSTVVDVQERTRRLIDLFLVSVLLDAGAGTKWQYKSKESGKLYRRSEGLAVASLEMFKAGLFSSDRNQPCQVDSAGLRRLDVAAVAKGLQVSDQNPIDGLEGRTDLLIRLADALQNQELFGLDARPGNMLGTIRGTNILEEGKLIKMSRLPPITSHHTSFVCPHNYASDTLVRPNGWFGVHLALNSHADRWNANWRRMAVLRHALTPNTSLGEHRSIPQTDTVADVLADGSNDKVDECTFRRKRATYRAARIP